MERFICVAGALTVVSLVFVSDANAAKGVKRNRSNYVRGTVIAVHRHGQGMGNVGNAGNFGQSGSFTIKTATHHRKRGMNGLGGNGGNNGNGAMGQRTHTMQVNSSTQFHRSTYGRRMRTHFGSLHQGEHVIVHTSGALARNVTILSSSRHRSYNRNYGYGVHRYRPYSRNYAQYHHHHRSSMLAAGLTNPVTPTTSNTNTAHHHTPTKPTTVHKVASNKPQTKKLQTSHHTHSMSAAHTAHHSSHSHKSGGHRKK